MSDETRRVDATGYVNTRDPRLNPSPAPQQRATARPAPQHMALPQHDDNNDYESNADHGQEYEAPPAPPAQRAAQQRRREPVQAVPAPQPDKGVIELSRAYDVHGEPLKRFAMRKPVAREIGKIGNPLKFDISEEGRITEVEARWDRVMKYISALSDPQIPPSVVEQFDYEDLDACAAFLGPFFLKVMKPTG